MRTRLLLVVLVAAGAAWFAGDRIASWVRPVALAAFAGSLLLLLWPRFGGRTTKKAGGEADPEPSTKDLWDAVDRGEDPTAR
ncbi:MAG: hypothetical protein HOV79_02940 [Hamadaea sp.]|nr:hypothetical protein [Hamadaea sp.]